MHLNLQIDAAYHDFLDRLRRQSIPRARQHLIEEVMRRALVQTIEHNPIRTGRSRQAWEACLEQIGGGAAGEGTVQNSNTDETTTIEATNNVNYVPYLEYGTSHMAPFAMVRDALAAVQGDVAEIGLQLEN